MREGQQARHAGSGMTGSGQAMGGTHRVLEAPLGVHHEVVVLGGLGGRPLDAVELLHVAHRLIVDTTHDHIRSTGEGDGPVLS